MKSIKHLFATGSILSLLATSYQSQAALAYNVSADAGNDIGVFSFFAPSYWTSGDIALPSGTTIGTTPLEIDLTLSHAITLDASGHFSWFLNYQDPIAVGNDLGSLYMVLLYNGSPVTSQVGFNVQNNFGSPVTQFGTGNYDNQLKDLVFDGVVIYVSNSNTPLENLTDIRISLDAIQPVPEPNTMVAGALMLVPFGVGALRKLRKTLTA